MAAVSPHGLLVVDKPKKWTSRDVVDRAQRWFPRGTRIGHTGTLDPLATGVLVLCVGAATRFTQYVQAMSKTYEAGVLLGSRSLSDDADGVITAVDVHCPPGRDDVERALTWFIGEVEQVPPAYSAAKLAGRRAYTLARSGQEISLPRRRVLIHRIDVLSYQWPRLQIEVRCGKGTYIRALARDVGERLGCGGLIETLRRTAVGPFVTNMAVSLDADNETAGRKLFPIESAVRHLPGVTLSAAEANRLRKGQQLVLGDRMVTGAHEVAAFDEAGRFVAVCRANGERLHPEKVISIS
jgi:tRNA pseudouridine55 synthase